MDMNIDEILKNRLLKLNQGSFSEGQGWRSILDDLLKLSYANGKQASLDHVCTAMEQYIRNIKELVTDDRIADAEKMSKEMLEFLNHEGEIGSL